MGLKNAERKITKPSHHTVCAPFQRQGNQGRISLFAAIYDNDIISCRIIECAKNLEEYKNTSSVVYRLIEVMERG